MTSCPKCGSGCYSKCEKCRRDALKCDECGFVAPKRFWDRDLKKCR